MKEKIAVLSPVSLRRRGPFGELPAKRAVRLERRTLVAETGCQRPVAIPQCSFDQGTVHNIALRVVPLAVVALVAQTLEQGDTLLDLWNDTFLPHAEVDVTTKHVPHGKTRVGLHGHRQ